MRLLDVSGLVLLLSSLFVTVLIYQLNPPDFYWNFNGIIISIVLGLAVLGVISIGLARVHLRRARERMIAVSFLVVGMAVPMTFTTAFFTTGQVGCLCGGTSGPSFVVTGNILVPLRSGDGTLTLQLRDNSANKSSITAVTFTNQGLENASTVPNIGNLVLRYQGAPVNAANPLPPGATASGSMKLANMNAGEVYEMEVITAFADGSHSVQALAITAQL